MMHWLHRLAGRTRRLATYAAGEMAEAEQRRTRALLAACPACRREVEAYRLVHAALQASPRVTLSPVEAEVFWPNVESRIHEGVTPAVQSTVPSYRELFSDHPRLGLVSAAAAVVLVLGLTLGPMVDWRPGTRGSNGAEVISVEVGENASVMLFQAPNSSLKVIWVFETPSS